jgi:ribosome maturation protein Sdo1
MQALDILKKLSWIKSVKIDNEYLIVDAPKDSAARINQTLAENKIFASELMNKSVSLE